MSAFNFKASVPVIDANVGIGHRHDRPSPAPDFEGLTAEMNRHGIERAVVYPCQGETISAHDANNDLANRSDHGDAFLLQWMASPTTRSLDQLRDLHAAGRLSSVRVNNTESPGNPFVHWLYGAMLEWCEAEAIPTWISLADADCVDVLDTLSRFPDLVTVLVGAHYTHALFVRPLLKNLRNAHLELSRYEGLGEVEALRHEFGIERFIYGSFFPRFQMGPMLYYLHHLDFNQDELAAVCAGNVTRVLNRGGSGQ